MREEREMRGRTTTHLCWKLPANRDRETVTWLIAPGAITANKTRRAAPVVVQHTHQDKLIVN